MVVTLKIGYRVIGELNKNRGNKVLIGTMYGVNPAQRSTTLPPTPLPPFIKGGSSTYKLIQN